MKKRTVGIALIGAVVVLGGWFLSRAGAKQDISYRTAQVARDTIVVTVSGSGQVSAENTIEIKPETSGKIVSVLARQGDTVKKGQLLARIDSRNAQLSLNTARASLQNAQANYQKLIAGLTTPELQSAKAALASAELALANAKSTTEITLKNADLTLTSAERTFSNTKEQQTLLVKNALATFLNAGLEAAPANTDTTVEATVGGAYTGTEQGSYRILVYWSTTGFNYTVSGLENTIEEVKRGFVQPLGTRGLTISFSSTGALKEGMEWTVLIPNTRASGYVSGSNSYQSALVNQSQALANGQGALDAAQIARTQAISSANASVANAENALASARAAYDLKIAEARPEDVVSSRAQIAQAQAQVDTAVNNLSNTAITAPIDGTLAVFALNPGDQASPSASIGTIITNRQTAKVTLNEVDVARVHAGDRATLTLDAIQDFTLTGHITAIDALGTASQGVVNYTVQIALDSQDARIKPGMSVTAAIITATKSNVLVLPSSAIKLRGGSSIVETLDKAAASDASRLTKTTSAPSSRDIQTGISNDTLTEIVSGLAEGEVVITQTILPNAKPTQTGNSAFGVPQVRIGGGAGGGGFRSGGGAPTGGGGGTR